MDQALVVLDHIDAALDKLHGQLGEFSRSTAQRLQHRAKEWATGYTDRLPESIDPKSWPRPGREESIRHREGQQRDVSAKTACSKQDIEHIAALAAE